MVTLVVHTDPTESSVEMFAFRSMDDYRSCTGQHQCQNALPGTSKSIVPGEYWLQVQVPDLGIQLAFANSGRSDFGFKSEVYLMPSR